MYHEFNQDIKKFNEIYKLPSYDLPVLPPKERIAHFIDIMKEELLEGHDLLEKYQVDEQGNPTAEPEKMLAILTELSDWLGDIIVYAASEARRAGIPLPDVLKVIMQSNFSKLDEAGEPICDERGKVLKGPNYWRPEQKIEALLRTLLK